MTGEQATVLEFSRDAKALVSAAVAVARSQEPPDHESLRAHLLEDAFLDRLDSEADYREASRFRLRVARVVDVLAKNPAPSAQVALTALVKDPAFIAQPDRAEALLEASVRLRPPAPEVVTFWDEHFQPDDEFTSTTVRVLVENGSEPALALLEQKLASPGHDDGDKVAWMRTDILSHRNDAGLLEMCERLLNGPLPRELCAPLVEAIFDYRPDEWYRPASVYAAPPLESASFEALEVLSRLAIFALTMIRLGDEQRLAVNTRLELVESIRERSLP
ncbi:MAG TPA: hypothetical protein VGP07_26940 [Polyangia bacterium]|jgi:hypothetical protein